MLPGANYIIQVWKVPSGSVVRAGETIAIAVQQAASSNRPLSSPAAPTLAAGHASSGNVAATTHKRPSKRRRLNVPVASSTSQPATSVKSNVINSGKSFAERYSGSSTNTTKQQQPSTIATSTNGDGIINSDKGDKSLAGHTIPVLATANGFLRSGSQDPGSDNVKDDSKKKLVIGFIEECLHPGLFGGLCIACGQEIQQKRSTSQNTADSGANHTAKMSTQTGDRLGEIPQKGRQNKNEPQHIMVTVSGGITMTVSESEGRHMAEQTSRRLWKLKKLSLVLDLDHTLVHATPDHRARLYCTSQHNDVRTLLLPAMEVPPPSSNTTSNSPAHALRMVGMQHFVKLRPHIKEFLQSLQPMYEMTVYTAGTRQYAEEITIVLCRYMVGAVLDHVELEHLRYTVARATAEYEKMYGANSSSAVAEGSETVSTTADVMDNTCDNEQAVKHQTNDTDDFVDEKAAQSSQSASKIEKAPKKSVSFGPPPTIEETSDANLDGGKTEGEQSPEGSGNTSRSDHITLEELNKLRRELEGAERLEADARELRQKLFGSRVVSRTDVGDLGRDVKSLKRIFPCGGTMAAVVDDREDVWANAADNSATTKKGEPPANLLLVRPYHWKPFVGFADVNNAAGMDLSSSSSNEKSTSTTGGSASTGSASGNSSSTDTVEETDVQLLWTSQILKELHARYYNTETEGDTTVDAVAIRRRQRPVPKILSEMRHEVLNGSTLVLSGLVPMHQKKTVVGQPRLPIIRYAETLGAKVC